jgi:hypothetical protein
VVVLKQGNRITPEDIEEGDNSIRHLMFRMNISKNPLKKWRPGHEFDSGGS